MSSNIENGGKDFDSVEIFELVRIWLTTTGEAISLAGQAIVLESEATANSRPK